MADKSEVDFKFFGFNSSAICYKKKTSKGIDHISLDLGGAYEISNELIGRGKADEFCFLPDELYFRRDP